MIEDAIYEWADVVKQLYDSMVRKQEWEFLPPETCRRENIIAMAELIKAARDQRLDAVIETVLFHGCNLVDIGVVEIKEKGTNLIDMLECLHEKMILSCPELLS